MKKIKGKKYFKVAQNLKKSMHVNLVTVFFRDNPVFITKNPKYENDKNRNFSVKKARYYARFRDYL